jgi:hypothetical protein
MFEHRTDRLLTSWQFAGRISIAFLLIVLLAAVSMLIGTLGYHFLAWCDWSDSFHFACLVLGNHDINLHPQSTEGRAFDGLYVMYARLVFISMAAILAAPILHRILHTLHLETGESRSQDGDQDIGGGFDE